MGITGSGKSTVLDIIMSLLTPTQGHLEIDGVKIDFDAAWVHLRKSNTEPIIRIYTEAKSELKAVELANRFVKEINSLL